MVTFRIAMTSKCHNSPFDRLRRGSIPQLDCRVNRDKLWSHSRANTISLEHYPKSANLFAVQRDCSMGINAAIHRVYAHIGAESFNSLIFIHFHNATGLVQVMLAFSTNYPEENGI